jgi:hypothetical protein
MAGVIKINPDIFKDKRDALAVAWDEALRLFMEDTGFEPEFEVTPEQLKFFRGTAYAEGDGTSAEKGGNVLRASLSETVLPVTSLAMRGRLGSTAGSASVIPGGGEQARPVRAKVTHEGRRAAVSADLLGKGAAGAIGASAVGSGAVAALNTTPGAILIGKKLMWDDLPTAGKLVVEDLARNAVNRAGRKVLGEDKTVWPGRTITEREFRPRELELMRDLYRAKADPTTGAAVVTSQHGGRQTEYYAATKDPRNNAPASPTEVAVDRIAGGGAGAASNVALALGGFGMRPEGGRVIARDTYDFKPELVNNMLTSDKAPERAKNKSRIDLGSVEDLADRPEPAWAQVARGALRRTK